MHVAAEWRRVRAPSLRCRAAEHEDTCVVLRMGLLRLFRDKADVVDLVMLHYNGGASGRERRAMKQEFRA